MKNAVRIMVGVVVGCLLSATVSAQMSFSTDFDGRGTGSRITVDTSRLAAAGPFAPTSGRNAAASDAQVLRQRYEAQLRAVHLQQELDRARARQNLIEIERVLELMQQLEVDEPSAIRRNSYTQQALVLERQFQAARARYLATLPTYRTRLAASLNHINVPPLVRPRRYASLLLWGALSTPLEARLAALYERNPFTGLPFDDVMAFGSRGVDDLARVTLDHLLGQLGRLSPDTRAGLGALKGATVDELVCHSNGCRIAETLIATGGLKVARLRILGGDNVAIELDYLRHLKQRHGISEVSVYLMRGDPVPLINPGWPLFDLTRRLGRPLQTFQNAYARDATYQLLGLASRPPFRQQAEIQIHTISDPAVPATRPIEAHRYERYARVINGLRSTGCLERAGAMSQKCIIH